jgi:hypothetical protein
MSKNKVFRPMELPAVEWDVFDQRLPSPRGREFEANLPHVGTVTAVTATQAIERATRRMLSMWPMVALKT